MEKEPTEEEYVDQEDPEEMEMEEEEPEQENELEVEEIISATTEAVTQEPTSTMEPMEEEEPD